MDISDSDMQMLHEKLKVPHLLCPSAQEAKKICFRATCKSKNAFFCSSQKCQLCLEQHFGCESIQIKDIFRLVQKRTVNHRKVLEEIMGIERTCIQNIQNQTKQFLQKIRWSTIPDQCQDVLDKIFKANKSKSELTSAEANELISFLRDDYKEDKSFIASQLKYFEQEANEIVVRMQNLKEYFYHSLQRGKTFFDDSRIIKQKQDIEFIVNSLGRPNEIEFIYRASQHNFSVAEFHRCCDHIPHTFILIRTKSGKTIAGYTPLTWETSGGGTADKQGKSFLLSIDLKQKMTLVKPEQAIYRHKDYAPCFGSSYNGGYDLLIYDQYDRSNNLGYFNFSYKFNKIYQKRKRSATQLSRVIDGVYFQVEDYEVYKIVL